MSDGVLILPLHRAPTRANFPIVTCALIVINAFVFLVLQSGDDAAERAALEYYDTAHLAQIEFPAYAAWLERQPDRRAALRAWREPGEDLRLKRIVEIADDPGFTTALDAGEIVTPADDAYADWRPKRTEFERLWNRSFSARWMLRFSELAPGRIFGAMFLHGGFMHLFGNMLFLAFLGLLVEGAVGHLVFLALYLLGGVGSALVSLAWHWSDVGAALGASGAIASLMGAYCVLWGLRRVRFFWWFFVVFDYVKAPALVLLPFWLGWELVNLFWNKGAHVGFDAHAGGIVVGALLALGIRALGRERRDFLDEERIADEATARHDAIARANGHIGRLEIGAARALLEPLAESDPGDLAVLVALYRCARNEVGRPRIDAAARAVLTRPVRRIDEVREQKIVHDDFARLGRPLPLTAAQQIALASRWPAIGAGADAAALVIGLAERAPATPGVAGVCLSLARRLRDRGDRAASVRVLEHVVAAWPESADADKARLLLSDTA